MVQKFRFGTPIETEATVAELSAIKVNSTEDAAPLARYVNLDFEKGFTLTRDMAQDDAV